MSLNAIPIKLMRSVDKVMDFDHERYATIYDAGRLISYTPFYAQNVNNANITVQCNPPDEKTVIFPEIYIKMDYDLVFTGTGYLGANLLTPGVFDAPRAYPMCSTTSTIDVKLNGTSFNTNLNEWFSTFIRSSNYTKQQQHEYSTCPSQLDMFQEYSLATGKSTSPFISYGENSAQDARGSYPYNILLNNNTNAHVTFSSVERLFLSPFYPSTCGFAGITTMSLTSVFSNLSRVWSHSNDATAGVIATLSASITGMTVYVKFITPKDTQLIPRRLVYPYHEVLITSTANNVITPALTSSQIVMSAINLQAVPKEVYIAIRERDQDLITNPFCYLRSDCFARIDQITLNFNNDQGRLSSTSIYDLYNLSRRQGLNMSYTEFASVGAVGSVCIVDISKEIGLGNLECPGKLSNPLLSMTVNYTSINPLRDVYYTLFVFIVYEGSMSINYGSVTKNIALFNSQDVLNASMGEGRIIVEHDPTNFYGGDFFSSIKNAFGKVKNFLKDTKAISRVSSAINHPVAQAVGKVAKAYGYGDYGGMQAGSIVETPPFYSDLERMGGAKKKKKKGAKKGKKAAGKMSRKELKRRMMGGNEIPQNEEDDESSDDDEINEEEYKLEYFE